MKRILIYSPYSYWYLHTLYEITVAHSLKLRGAEPVFVCCDGVYSDCDVAWKAVSPRNAETCRKCTGKATEVFAGMEMPTLFLSAFLNQAERDSARAWANSLTPKEMYEARYLEQPLGQWVISSVHSHFRTDEVETSIPEVAEGFRSYLYSGAIALSALYRIFDQVKPDSCFLFNGRMFSQRICLELALQLGIPTLVHERGFVENSLSLFENDHTHSLSPIEEQWPKWRDTPLNAIETAETAELLEGRETGALKTWQSKFVKAWQNHAEVSREALMKNLGIGPEKRLIGLFNSCEDEGAYLAKQRTIIEPKEWIERTIRYFAARPEFHLIFRVHPNMAGVTGKNENFLKWLREYVETNPHSGLSVIWPGDPVNTYRLIDYCELCLTLGSTVSLEAAVRGCPSLVAKRAHFYQRGFATDLADAADYEQTLDRMIGQPITREQVRLAFRFAHTYFFRLGVRFPLVQVERVHEARPAYSRIEELAPGKDHSLDQICNWLLEGTPLYPEPGAHAQRSQAEEDLIDQVLARRARVSGC